MGTRAKGIPAVALLLMITIIPAACTPKEVPLPILREAPDFALTNQDGQEVRLSDFRGKVVVMTFIYASCPTVCPTINHKLKTVWDELEEGPKQGLVLISVSFDPAVDTPEVLKQYAIEQGFDVPWWQFLTGTQEQIRQVTDDYGVAYELLEVVKDEVDPQYEGPRMRYNHSVVIVLIDSDGMVRKTYGDVLSPNTEMIGDITSLF